jgi:hypothetical protein
MEKVKRSHRPDLGQLPLTRYLAFLAFRTDQGLVFPSGTNVTQREALVFNKKDNFAVEFAYSGTDAYVVWRLDGRFRALLTLLSRSV